MLGMAYIRVLEVATFYFMFQLQPVGSVAHVQVCGTTSCMICGAEDLIEVCRRKIAPHAHEVSADGKFSWEEVECLGACANAPMAQIGKDYYEDLTAERFAGILDAFARGEVPRPGPQNGRFASEPLGGLTALSGAPRQLRPTPRWRWPSGWATRWRGSPARSRRREAVAGRASGCGSTPRERSDKGPAVVPRRPAGLAAPRGARAGRSEADQGRGAGARGDAAPARLLPFRPDRGLDPGGGGLGRRESRGFPGAGSSARAGSSRRASWPSRARRRTPRTRSGRNDAGLGGRAMAERDATSRTGCSGRW